MDQPIPIQFLHPMIASSHTDALNHELAFFWPTNHGDNLQHAPRTITKTTNNSTVIKNLFKSGRQYWAARSSARSFARTANPLACSALLASLARSPALIRSLTHSPPSSWDSGIFTSGFSRFLNHCATAVQVVFGQASSHA